MNETVPRLDCVVYTNDWSVDSCGKSLSLQEPAELAENFSVSCYLLYRRALVAVPPRCVPIRVIPCQSVVSILLRSLRSFVATQIRGSEVQG